MVPYSTFASLDPSGFTFRLPREMSLFEPFKTRLCAVENKSSCTPTSSNLHSSAKLEEQSQSALYQQIGISGCHTLAAFGKLFLLNTAEVAVGVFQSVSLMQLE